MALSASQAANALVITPTFDATITGDPNAAAIEGVINSAISIYQTTFSDPITVPITFREMTTGLGQSNFTVFEIPYSTLPRGARRGCKNQQRHYRSRPSARRPE